MTAPRRAVDLVEDDPILGASLRQRLAVEGIEARWSRSAGDALVTWLRRPPELVVCDLRLPDLDGETLFRRAQERFGPTPFLFITAYGEIEQAVRLVRHGAIDYLTKPFDVEELVERLRAMLRQSGETTGQLGASAAMRRIEALLRRIADIDSTVLLTGESGVGKEVAARFLHGVSTRATAPFIAVNCAAIPHELIESELFGHEKGAFTGAQSRHRGYAERAGPGSLFLDEIGDLPATAQVKLLRLLQERCFYRLGGEAELPFAARIVCASNRDLAALVRDGRFREDLFYRINVIPIQVPPLRERPDDIVPLLLHYVREFGSAFGRPRLALSGAAEEAALAHGWPGNVRELRNRVERAVALAEGATIDRADLFPGERGAGVIATLAEARDAAERRQIERALAQTDGRIQAAAALLGVSRTTLWEKMRRLGIDGEG